MDTDRKNRNKIRKDKLSKNRNKYNNMSAKKKCLLNNEIERMTREWMKINFMV